MAVCFFVLAVSRERIPAFVQITLQFSYILTRNGIPAMLSSAITSKVAFLLALNLLLLFLGMIMDAELAIKSGRCTPMSFGIDPVQLGCIIVFNLSVGQATPPFGLCLFAAQPVTKQSIGILSRAVFPFVIILYAMVLTTSFIPALSLAIPNLM